MYLFGGFISLPVRVLTFEPTSLSSTTAAPPAAPATPLFTNPAPLLFAAAPPLFATPSPAAPPAAPAPPLFAAAAPAAPAAPLFPAAAAAPAPPLFANPTPVPIKSIASAKIFTEFADSSTDRDER